MATHGEKRWPPAGRFNGRLRGAFHGHRHRSEPGLAGGSWGVRRVLVCMGALESRVGLHTNPTHCRGTLIPGPRSTVIGSGSRSWTWRSSSAQKTGHAPGAVVAVRAGGIDVIARRCRARGVPSRHGSRRGDRITFDFRSDTPPGRDPDALSPTLRRYHQLLWSKPLPSGAPFELDGGPPLLERSPSIVANARGSEVSLGPAIQRTGPLGPWDSLGFGGTDGSGRGWFSGQTAVSSASDGGQEMRSQRGHSGGDWAGGESRSPGRRGRQRRGRSSRRRRFRFPRRGWRPGSCRRSRCRRTSRGWRCCARARRSRPAAPRGRLTARG